jgi:hypothetical protein
MLFFEKIRIILRRLSENYSVGELCVCGYQSGAVVVPSTSRNHAADQRKTVNTFGYDVP